MSKVIGAYFGFAFRPRSVFGFKNSATFSTNQKYEKLKPRVFPALEGGHVASSSDLLITLFAHVVIGQINNNIITLVFVILL